MSISITANAHVLVYPYPTSGHIIPLLDLTHQLLTRGLTVTVLVTPANLPLLDPLRSCYVSSSSLQPLVLPSPEPKQHGRFNMQELRDLHYPLILQWIQSHQSPPVAIVSDFFLGWTHQLASQVGVPRIVFSPSGAFGLSMFFSLWRDQPKVDDRNDANSLLTFPNLPNCPVFRWYQIPQLFRIHKEGEPGWEFQRNNSSGNMASWGIVLNTSTHLERIYIEHLKREMGHDRVWAVGPVLPQDGDSTNRGGSSSVPCHEVMTWLDAREDGSVIYVCFGSRGWLTSKQMDELAAGLETSGVHFIWCVRQPKGGNAGFEYPEDIPDGFEDRVDGRGYIIKGWAPQVPILRHRAVGTFLTHCGWNSTLEGVAAGVAMLTWPMGAEQYLNAQLIDKELGVGIRVGEGTQSIPKSRELARLLAASVDGTRPEKDKAKELRDAVLGSVVKGGSSDTDLDDFVRRLNELKSVNVVTNL